MESFKSNIIWGGALDLIGGGLVSLLPENFNWFGWPFLIIGTFLLIFAFWDLIARKLKWKFFPSWKLEIESFFPWRILIPLNRACCIAYEKLRNYDAGLIAERLHEENPLRYFSAALVQGNRLYGSHPPSTRIELIDQREMGWLQDDGSNTRNVSGNIIYADLMIERRCFKNYIRETKKMKL